MTLLPIVDQIPEFTEISQVHNTLHERGCRRCSLGFQNDLNGCCVARGTFDTKRMILGEAPGKEEDARGLPFTGPAGQLLDKIWTAAGMDSDDWYISNVIHCRPIAEKGSGKQNLTPKVDQLERCKPYWQAEVKLLAPKIIVTMGGVATQMVLGRKIKIGQERGKLIRHTFEFGWADFDTWVYPMIHPAAILHSTGGPNYHTYRAQTWEDVQRLKNILIQYSI